MTETNSGHGHVFPRADGVKARCGGPALCAECALDLVRRAEIERDLQGTGTIAWDARGPYTETEVLEFLGWLSADLPELHGVEAPRLLEAWQRFKALVQTAA